MNNLLYQPKYTKTNIKNHKKRIETGKPQKEQM